MSQREWNRKARIAGRKAAAEAKRNGASKETIRRAYNKAYQKKWYQSPKGKASLKKYIQSPKGKAFRKKYAQSPERKASLKAYSQSPNGKASRRNSHSTTTLIEALAMTTSLKNGWPDAGRTEQKIGADWINLDQWRRAAWAYSKGITFKLLLAETHEDAALNGKYRIISFKTYAEELGMLKQWSRLVQKLAA